MSSGVESTSDVGDSTNTGVVGTSTSGADTVGSESSGGSVVVCDEACALPDLQEAWSLRLVDDMAVGPLDPYFGSTLQPDGALLLTVLAASESRVVRVSSEGVVSVFDASTLGIDADATIWSPFAGPDGVVLSYSREVPPESGLARYDADLEFVCGTTSGDRVWTEAAAYSTSTWGLFAVELPSPGIFSVSVGDPCAPTVGSLLELDPEDAGFKVTGFAFDEVGSLLLAGYLHNSDDTFFVRTYDGGGAQTGSWSDNTLDLRTRARAHWLPDGRVLAAGWSDAGGTGNYVLQTAYVDAASGTADVASHDGLRPPQPGTPKQSLAIDSDGTPRVVYGDRFVRVTSLPSVEGLPCCPGSSELWQTAGMDQYGNLYPVDDGVIAVTGAESLEAPGAYDIVVTRFVFTR